MYGQKYVGHSAANEHVGSATAKHKSFEAGGERHGKDPLAPFDRSVH